MIDPWVAQELHRIERGIDADDPRFAAAFRRGTPRPPREYRRRRWYHLLAALAVTLTMAVALTLAVSVPLGIVSGILAGPATLAAVVLTGRFRARRRLRRRRAGPR